MCLTVFFALVLLAFSFILFALFDRFMGPREFHSFAIIALGTSGGIDQSSVSSYLLTPLSPHSDETNNFMCLDGGTSLYGIQKAVDKGRFRHFVSKKDNPKPENGYPLTFAGYIFQQRIKGYFISHPHLDHWLGWALDSVNDIPTKPVLGINSTISALQENIFNSRILPDLGNYQFISLEPEIDEFYLESVNVSMRTFLLSHGKVNNVSEYLSSALLIRNANKYVLYLGDTGPDEIEGSSRLYHLWYKMAPLIQSKALKAIFLECSFPNDVPDSQLYGHLNPKWFMNELHVLNNILIFRDAGSALEDFPIIVTHIKPQNELQVVGRMRATSASIIRRELKELNDLKLNLIFPKQGDLIYV